MMVVLTGATSATYTTPTLVFANDNLDRYRVVASLVGAAAILLHHMENLQFYVLYQFKHNQILLQLLKETLQPLLLLHL